MAVPVVKLLLLGGVFWLGGGEGGLAIAGRQGLQSPGAPAALEG